MAAISPIMNIMIKAAEKAARSLIRDFGEVENLQTSRKGPADFVTAADKRSEEIIFTELKKARPEFSFLMEESGKVEGKDKNNKWIIDPLDGTHNFIHGIPHWCISIALENKGEVVAGVVFDPIQDELFFAEKGSHSKMRTSRGHKSIRVSSRSVPDACCIGCDVPFVSAETHKKYIKELDRVSITSPLIRRFGAAALSLCYVASGRLDAYWAKNLKPWDVAAGTLIVKEAGGFITSIDNDDNPIYSRQVVAGNPTIHKEIRRTLTSLQ